MNYRQLEIRNKILYDYFKTKLERNGITPYMHRNSLKYAVGDKIYRLKIKQNVVRKELQAQLPDAQYLKGSKVWIRTESYSIKSIMKKIKEDAKA